MSDPSLVFETPCGNKHQISWTNLRVIRPREQGPGTPHLYPATALAQGKTYSSSVLVDVSHTCHDSGGNLLYCQEHACHNMCPIPCMLRSHLCWLSDWRCPQRPHMTTQPGGLFIINGNLRVLVSQMQRRHNWAHITERNVEVRSEHENQWRSTSTFRMHRRPDRTVVCHLPFVVNAYKKSINIPLRRMMCHLGWTKNEEGEGPDLGPGNAQDDGQDLASWLDARGCRHSNGETTSLLKYVFKREFLPHVTPASRQEYIMELITEMDAGAKRHRDDHRHRRIAAPGVLMATLFRQLFRIMVRNVRVRVTQQERRGSQPSLRTLLCMTATRRLAHHFGTGQWSLTNGVNEGVSQYCGAVNRVGVISHLQRVSLSVRSSICAEPRFLHPSDWGHICGVETPEGQGCGLIKNLALTAHITVGLSTTDLQDTVEMHGQLAKVAWADRGSTTAVPLRINGVPSTRRPATRQDADALAHQLRTARQQHLVAAEISVYWMAGRLHVDAQVGTTIRPLLAPKGGPAVVYRATPTEQWRHMMWMGEVDYLSKCEELCAGGNIRIQLQSQITDKRHHSELSNLAQFGIAAATAPLCHMNQAPRHIYQSSMCKQALRAVTPGGGVAFQASAHQILYAQRPLVPTTVQTEVDCGYKASTTMSAVVAVMAWSGNNQEDSLLLKASSAQRGFGRVVTHRQYQHTGDDLNDHTLTVCDPRIPNQGDKGKKRYTRCDVQPDGMPKLRQTLQEGDVVIGRLRGRRSSPHKRTDASILYDHKLPGRVVRRWHDPSNGRYGVVTVTFRTLRVGDKLASRHAQKGTIGQVVPDEDMPFNQRTGMSPDLILNPHAFPSRMTVGQLAESILGKCAAITGKIRKASGDAFTDTPRALRRTERELRRLGFNPTGTERMRDGRTGRLYDSQIFTGCVSMQRLRHMVADKVHSRGIGPRGVVLRQPLEGRSRGGGLRVGEMERDVIMAQGASRFLQDRLMDSSDAVVLGVCSQCGQLRNKTTKASKCRHCSCERAPKRMKIPYATKVLIQELEAMNIGVRMR